MDFTPQLRNEYRQRFRTAEVNANRKALVAGVVDSLVAKKARYERVGDPLDIPWWFVAVIHDLEA